MIYGQETFTHRKAGQAYSGDIGVCGRIADGPGIRLSVSRKRIGPLDAGIAPAQYADFKSLTDDTADNIKGAGGTRACRRNKEALRKGICYLKYEEAADEL